MIEVNELYKVRKGYTCFIGCNILDAGKFIKVSDSNLCVLNHQQWKLEKQVDHLDNKMMKRNRGRPPKLKNK